MSKSFGYGRTQLTSLTANRSIRQLADPLPKQSPVHAPSFLKTSKQPILNTRVWSLSSSLSSVPEQHAVLSSVPRSLLHATACVREQKSQDPASSLYHIKQDGTGNYIVASQDIRAGTVILTETGTVEKAASKYSVQLGEGEHLLMPGDIKLANHSCNSAANCIFELHKQPTPHGRLVAMRDIKAGDSLAFDYETTEWDMESPFDCACGAPTCRGRITGFKHLTNSQRKHLPSKAISAYIRSKWEQQQKQGLEGARLRVLAESERKTAAGAGARV